jgi:hypothetical protein
MWRSLNVRGKVAPGMVPVHVLPAFPQIARADIDNPALVHNIDWAAVPAVTFFNLFKRKFPHKKLPLNLQFGTQGLKNQLPFGHWNP